MIFYLTRPAIFYPSILHQRKYLVRYFEYLVDCVVHNMIPDEQKAFQKTYLKADFDAQKMRLTCSYLLRLVEQFLVQIEQQEDAYFYKNHLLLKAYRKRHLDSHFQKTYKKQINKWFKCYSFFHSKIFQVLKDLIFAYFHSSYC